MANYLSRYHITTKTCPIYPADLSKISLKSKTGKIVERLFLTVPWGCLWFVIVVFTDHTHLLYFCHFLPLMGVGQI